jgi:hypothetical protein
MVETLNDFLKLKEKQKIRHRGVRRLMPFYAFGSACSGVLLESFNQAFLREGLDGRFRASIT